MNKKLIKIAVTGVYGRMGTSIIQEIQKEKNIILNLAIVKKKKNNIILMNGNKIEIIDNIQQIEKKINTFDILIDFSTPQATLQYLELCKLHNKKIVIGTTGFNTQEKKIIQNYSNNISIVFSSNFSIGINLIFTLLGVITKTLDSSYDIEIIEAHHKNKLDSPSGTALQIGEIIAQQKGFSLNECSIYRKKDTNNHRKKEHIGFSIIRAGDIVGQHNIMFAGMGEKLEIIHTASNRNAFSKGAIKAACWLYDKPVGLYNMQDVLNI